MMRSPSSRKTVRWGNVELDEHPLAAFGSFMVFFTGLSAAVLLLVMMTWTWAVACTVVLLTGSLGCTGAYLAGRFGGMRGWGRGVLVTAPTALLCLPALFHWLLNAEIAAVWAGIALVGIGTGVAGETGRRVLLRREAPKVGCCAGCGYDLRGLPRSGPCPECGAEPT